MRSVKVSPRFGLLIYQNSTRKVYMLSHLEPSTEITGGPWFSDNELDIEFIEEICKTCYKYVAANVP